MRHFLILGAVVAAFALACGTTSSPRKSTADAGSSVDAGSGSCTDDTECHSGSFCIVQSNGQGKCGTCNSATKPLTCPQGTTCNHHSGACDVVGGTGGSTGGSTGGTTGSVACTHRTDCPGAEACVGPSDGGAGTCQSVDADAGCNADDDLCPKAYVCVGNACQYGCRNGNDCHGTTKPVCEAGSPLGYCGACVSNAECHTDENCQAGQCVAKTACTDASTCGGLGCVNGFCGPCTGEVDCSNGNVCDTTTGHCTTPPSGCTSDAQCQSSHGGQLAYYCDQTQTTPSCKLGCTPDSQCPGQPGCCNLAAGQTCDRANTYSCVQTATTNSGNTGTTSGTTGTTGTTSTTGGTTGGCGSFDCQQCFDLGESCDTTNCQCIGVSSSGGSSGGTGGTGGGSCGPSGGQGQPCGDGCECSAGLSCYDFFGGGPYSSSDASTCATLNAFGCGTFCF